MRVNIYSQEIDLATPPQIIVQDGEGISGKETFYGIRFYLHSSDKLHDTEGDDDRSAVTFWLPKSEDNRLLTAAQFTTAADIITEVIIPAMRP